MQVCVVVNMNVKYRMELTMGIKIKDLLELLDDTVVQEKIRCICGMQKRAIYTMDSTDEQSYINTTDKNQIKELEQKLNQVNAELQKYQSYAGQIQQKNNVYQQENGRLNNRISDLRTELDNIKLQLQTALAEKRILENDIKDFNREKQNLTSALHSANTALQALKNQFQEPVACLAMYRSLSETTRDGLSDVVCDKNEVLWIASCTSADHLKKIWEYTKEILSDEERQEDVEILKKIFDYFFDIYNASLPEPIYQRDDIQIEDEYDDEKHIRSRDSETSGLITKILLRGYYSINTGYAICKSVVKI